jgi:hypothetical protein
MQIIAPISVGELIDKITILEIKMERLSDWHKRANVERELAALIAVPHAATPELKAELSRVNRTLWDVEDEIRKCDAGEDFGPKFVALAKSVYRLNDERARLKKVINIETGSELREEKSYG